MNQLIMPMREQYQVPRMLTALVSVHLLQSPSDGDLCKHSSTVDTAAARQTLSVIR